MTAPVHNEPTRGGGFSEVTAVLLSPPPILGEFASRTVVRSSPGSSINVVNTLLA